MDQNSNYITIEMNLRLQMICRAPHTICYGKRWIMWTVLIVKLIPALWQAIAPHNPPKVIEQSGQTVIHDKSPVPSGG